MSYSFDEIVDRRNTNSMKWDTAKERGFPEDAYPMWVADMDIKCPPEVIAAVHATAEHGIFGYTDMSDEYFEATKSFLVKRHGFEPEREWFFYTPGVAFAFCAAIKAFTAEGDGVLIQPPVYGPFTAAILNNKRKVIENPLVLKDGRYEMDFDDLEEKLKLVKLMIFCSPHNPVCRVWTTQELKRVGELCLKHDVIMVSDEIHSDFAFAGHKHHIFTTVDKRFMQNTIVATAPSKTFNIAGLQLSNIFAPNPELCKSMRDVIASCGYDHPTTCGLAAATAAFKYGEPWLDALMPYLEANANYVIDYISTNLPDIKVTKTDGTFLLWLDFHALKLTHEQVRELLLTKAKLWLDDGLKFGAQGEGFMRLNIGCPRSVLEEAMAKLNSAVNG